MSLRAQYACLLVCGLLPGCLTSNPALTDGGAGDSSGDTGGSPSSGLATSGGPDSAGTDVPETGDPPTGGVTSDPGKDTDPGTTTDPGTSTDPGRDSDPTETTGPAACGADNVCVEEAPAGWSGPVIWAEVPIADDSPSCPVAYPEAAFSAFDGLLAPPAECDCSCGGATGAACAAITLEAFTNSSCSGSASSTHAISGTSCQSISPPGGVIRFQADDPGVTGGSCTPSATTDIPPATWEVSATVCGGASEVAGACEDGSTCLPRPEAGFESRVCVWQPGVLECPDSGFADRFIRHAAIEDDRSCLACECGAPQGECSGSVVISSASNCSISLGGATIGGDCFEPFSGQLVAARGSGLSVGNVSCEPSVGTATGEAEPSDPYTLCCMTVD